MYELDDYLAMVTDRLRTPAYLDAMRAVIRPGDRVLDLGTGFGFFAVHACRLGAAHVSAVEPNDAIALGRAVAEANGCADRITFIQDWSERVHLAQRADVLIEDLRGISPLHGTRFEVLRDARSRLLVDAARRVPLADELLVAPAELPDDLARFDADAPDEIDGVRIAPVRERLRDAVLRTRGGADSLLADGAIWARVDLAAPPSGGLSGTVEFRSQRAGRLHGLLSWFRATLAPGISFETHPSGPRSVYDRAFLPLPTPVAILEGDRIITGIRTRSDGVDHVWVWEVQVERAGIVVAKQRGANLASRARSAARRALRASDHQPARTDAIELLASLTAAVDGVARLDAIAATLHARHPEMFRSEQEALRWAGDRLGRLAEEPTH